MVLDTHRPADPASRKRWRKLKVEKPEYRNQKTEGRVILQCMLKGMRGILLPLVPVLNRITVQQSRQVMDYFKVRRLN